MTFQSWQPTRAYAWYARCSLRCVATSLLLVLATPAFSDTIRINGYNTWQWNQFSWSPPPVAVQAGQSSSQGLGLSSLVYSELANVAAAAGGGTAVLSGYAYVDIDGSGKMDNGDWCIGEARISLTEIGGTDPLITVYTAADGSFRFESLLPGDYTIAALDRSNQPGQDTLGELQDKNGNPVSTGRGTITPPNQFVGIHLEDGYMGTNYNFAELVYPIGLISKRMLTDDDPHIPIVPEPGSLLLLAIAGLFFGGLTWGRRNRP